MRLFNETGQHGDDSALARTIVAEKHENLTVIHLHVHSFNSSKAARECLLKILNSKILTSSFQSLTDNWRRLVIICRHLVDFKLIVKSLALHQSVLLILAIDLVLTAIWPAASVIGGRAQEAGTKALAKVRRDHLVHVESKEGEDEEIDKEHPEGRIERVFLIHDRSSGPIETHASSLVIGETDRSLQEGHLGEEGGNHFDAAGDIVADDHLVEEHAHKVEYRGDNASVLGACEH